MLIKSASVHTEKSTGTCWLHSPQILDTLTENYEADDLNLKISKQKLLAVIVTM